jgi:hypothetical protein
MTQNRGSDAEIIFKTSFQSIFVSSSLNAKNIYLLAFNMFFAITNDKRIREL